MPAVESDRQSEARPRRRRRRVLGLLALGLLVAAAIAAVAVRARLDGWVRERLERELVERLGATAEIGSLELNLRRLEARFEAVRVSVPAGEAPPLRFEIRRGRVRAGWRSLRGWTAGRQRLAEVVLEGPVLELSREFLAARERREGRRSPLAIRIDRLELRAGELRYDDRTTPLELRAEGLELSGEWSPGRRLLEADAKLSSTVMRAPFTRPLPVELESRLVWNGPVFELPGAVLRAPGAELVGDWIIDTAAEAWLSGEVRLSGDLGVFRGWLAPPLADGAGTVQGPLTVSGGGGALEVEGRLVGRDLRLERFDLERAAARLRYAAGLLRLDEIEAAAYGGSARGTLDLLFDDERRFTATLDGEDLRLGSLLELAGRPLPFRGSTRLVAELAGDPGDVLSWSGRGTASAAAGFADGGPGIPTAGTASLEITPGRLRARSAGLAVGEARVDLDLDLGFAGEPRGRIEVAGVTADASATLADTRLLLERLGVGVPDVMQRPLAGTGSFSAGVDYGEAAAVRVALDLSRGSWAGQDFDEATLGLDLRGDRLDVTGIRAVSADHELSGSFAMRLGDTTLLSADVEARNLELQPVLDLALAEPPELGGTLTGRLALERAPDGLNGTGRAAVRDVRWLGERLEEVSAELSVAADRLNLAGVLVRGPAIEASGAAEVDLASGAASIEIAEGTVRIEQLELVTGRELDARGEVRTSGRVELGREGLSGGELALVSDDSRILGWPLGPVSGTLTLGAGRIDARLAGEGEAGWNLTGRMDVADETLPVEASLVLDDATFDLMRAEAGRVWTRLRGEIDVAGPLATPERLVISARLADADLHAGTKTLRAAAPFTAGLLDGRLTAGPVAVAGESFRLDAELAVTLEDRSVQATARGGLDMGVLAALLPNLRASGVADVDLRVEGTLDAPQPTGTLRLGSGRARLLGFPHTLEQVSFDVTFDRETARLDGFSGLLGGGEVRASGQAALVEGGLGDFEIAIDGEGLRLDYPEGFRGVYDGDLLLESVAGQTRLAGRVDVLRGVYRREFDLFQLAGFGVREYEAVEETPLPDVALDVRLRAADNVWLRNDLAEVESGFELGVGGDLNRPEVTGRLTMLEGGKLRFRDVDYRITSGTLTFLDLERINPYLDLRAETTVGSYEVFLHVEGTLERFEYELTSNPALSPQDIIALLTTGRTLQDLTTRGEAAEGVFAGDLAANYFAGALTDRFEKQLQRLLGLERLQIDPLLVGERADPTARITLGKEVADNLFVIASTRLDQSERQLYQIEWQASRNLQVTAERGTTGGIGGEFRYTDRFWLRRPPPASREPARPAGEPEPAREPPARAPVREVSIEGVDPQDARELRRRVPLNEGEPFTRSAMFEGAESIRRYFARRGRIQAEVQAAVGMADPETGVSIAYTVRPGPETTVLLEGVEGKHEKAVRRLLETQWVESIWSEDLFQDAARRVRELYQERGFYTADVQAQVASRDGRQTVTFVVDPGKPVRVRTIRIRGAEGVEEDRIRRQILTRSGTIFSRRQLVPRVLQEDVLAIRNLYRDQGYLAAEIDEPQIRLSTDGESATVILTIREGPRFTIERIDFSGELPFPRSTLEEWSGLASGGVFSRRKLLEAESAIRGRLDEHGYPDARVRGHVELLEDSVALRFDVDSGPLKRVGTVELVGNRRTKERVIRRELLLRPGEVVSRERVLRSQHQLYKLGVFRNVRIDYEPLGADDASLQRVRVEVEEERPIGVTVGAGYDSEEKLRGTFSVLHHNLGGWDRTVAFQTKFSDVERRLQLTATEPRLAGLRLPLIVNLTGERRDEVGFSLERRSAAVRLENRINPRWTAFTRYNFQRVDLLEVENPDPLLQRKLENIQLGDLSFAIVRDTRDDPFQTNRGMHSAAEVRVFASPFLSESTFVKSFFQTAATRPLANRQSHAWAVRLGLSETSGSTRAVPLSERFFAGGDSTLRGFPRDQVGPLDAGTPLGGEAMLLLNQEWRFPIWSRLRGVLFYDAGNVYLTLDDLDPLDLRHVLGVGLRLETPIGPIRLEYGRKLDREAGESSGELFLAIGAAF